jgi:hypothetical protein
VAIFGRKTARRRLRRATRESLKIPTFSSPIDCTPWVTGGLWPEELSTITAETAALADYLRDDLQRITRSTNDQLKVIKRADMTDSARQAKEARVIDEARARAVRRVESTIRHVRAMKAGAPAGHPRGQATEPFAWTDIGKVQGHDTPVAPPAAAAPLGGDHDEPKPAGARHRVPDDVDIAGPVIMPELEAVEAVETPETLPPQAVETPASEAVEVPAREAVETAAASEIPETSETPETVETATAPEIPETPETAETVATPEAPEAVETPETPETAETVAAPEIPETLETPETVEVPVVAESDSERLQRLLAFVVHQEPRLNWAVGDHADGTTVLVTDLAHGWIPPGITLPAGVRLLEPGRRTGKISALVGTTTRTITYTPGDSVGRPADFAATEPSVQPRELPAVDDLGWELGRVTHWRDGLPRIVHTLAKAAAAGTGVVEEEADLLRVHLETARYQLLSQYPDVAPALLLNCLLLAATESSVGGDSISANYHFAWFHKLDEPPASQWTATT